MKEDWKKKIKIIFLKEENKVSWFSNWKKNFPSLEKNLPQKIERRIWEQRRIWEENRPPAHKVTVKCVFMKTYVLDLIIVWLFARLKICASCKTIAK